MKIFKKIKNQLKIGYKKIIKPIFNIVTLRKFRYLFKYSLQVKKNIKLIKNLEQSFPDNVVLIFQHQFFDKKGETCYNGGAERYVIDLSNILISMNYTPILIQKGHKNLWDKIQKNTRIIGIPAKNNEVYLKSLRGFTKFKFTIYSGATHWNKMLHPNILISHGITWDKPNKNVNIKEISNIFSDIDFFVSVDTNTISWLRTTFAQTMKEKDMCYIPNYVDLETYKPISRNNNRIKVIFPRRLSPERGYWLTSNIVSPIITKYQNIDIDFVGFAHGSEIINDVKKLIDKFPNRINHYLVEPENMANVYQNADIALIPTEYSEGTSLSCLEAQAAGNVVISTNIGGLPNLIIDGYNGLLINPSEAELLVALDRVLRDTQLRSNLSKNAIKVSHAFNKQIWLKKWKENLKRFEKKHQIIIK